MLCLFAAFPACLAPSFAQTSFPGAKPADIPEDWKPMIGDYESRDGVVTLLERDKTLYLSGKAFGEIPFAQDITKIYVARAGFEFGFAIAPGTSTLREARGDTLSQAKRLDHTATSGAANHTDVNDLRRLALSTLPPEEKRQFRTSDLVELPPLDPAIHLDIRYATSNNFLGTPVYTQARAFLQRPAAEALLRALRRLQPYGYGLLIHDGYRPWYVTKIFWDATPPEGKIFVADPAQGSRHNRGCAVDLTLYDLKTGQPAEMTGTYDEMSPRSFPNYPGGTSLQRWHRDLLRWAMESEGFTVYEAEWWHFDYKDWHDYAIGNTPFEKLNTSKN